MLNSWQLIIIIIIICCVNSIVSTKLIEIGNFLKKKSWYLRLLDAKYLRFFGKGLFLPMYPFCDDDETKYKHYKIWKSFV